MESLIAIACCLFVIGGVVISKVFGSPPRKPTRMK